MNHYHFIHVKTLPVTNKLDNRVSISSKRFKERIIIPWDCDEHFNYLIASNYLRNKGFEIVGFSELGGGEFALLSTTFKNIKDGKHN